MAGQPIRQVLSLTGETFRQGERIVTTAGTAVPLSTTPLACNEVLIQTKSANAGSIYVGGPGVTAAIGIRLIPVAAGVQPPSIQISCEDLSKIWINSSANLEGVNFLYW